MKLYHLRSEWSRPNIISNTVQIQTQFIRTHCFNSLREYILLIIYKFIVASLIKHSKESFMSTHLTLFSRNNHCYCLWRLFYTISASYRYIDYWLLIEKLFGFFHFLLNNDINTCVLLCNFSLSIQQHGSGYALQPF